ncbi:GFA family protein [Roseiarcus sp.]|uniref:GFA family protein n=1 Tax=Roseiarcus sp. TaxID=1969460 RepID=UPI003F9DA5C6
MAFAGVPMADLDWTRGSPKVFASSAIAERGFCADCGTPLTYRILVRDRISITLGSLDCPSDVPPRMQYGVESKVPWIDAIAGLPQREIAGLFGPGVNVESRQHPDHDT